MPLALQTPIEETLALLRASMPVEPLVVLANATQLQQVVMNLCTNAWQAFNGADGQIELLLDAVQLGAGSEPPHPDTLAPGRYARMQVRDNGCGMDIATQAHIFRPFFTTKPVGSGTGQGLAVVHGIVTSLGGAIVLGSIIGEGSSFDVYLPLLDSALSAVAADAVPPVIAQRSEAADRGAHVAYVDDDELMLIMVQQLLQRLGYRVSAFAEPMAALDALRLAPHDFDIVVTDFNMPVMSGMALAEAVLALRGDLPVVVSSGYVTDELRRTAQRLGVREVLQKEYTFDPLGALVQRVLAQPP